MINFIRGVYSRFYYIRFNKKFFKDFNMWKVFFVGRKGYFFFFDNIVISFSDMYLYINVFGIKVLGDIYGKWF